MTITATRSTALVSGAIATFALTVFDMVAPHFNLSPQLGTLTFFVALLILWVLPSIVFGAGFDLKRWDPDYVYQPGAFDDYREIGIRSVFWTVGSIVCWVAMRLAI